MNPNDPKLSDQSKRFAAQLFAGVPWLADHATFDSRASQPPHDLLVQLRSPTGDDGRMLTIWMEDGEPSVEFGAWHTHATVWGAARPGEEIMAIIELIQAIVADEFVLIEDVGGEHSGHIGVLDRRNKDDILDELTSKWSPGRVRIKSWTGSVDEEIGLDDFEGGPTA